jgi:hypothetical protein
MKDSMINITMMKNISENKDIDKKPSKRKREFDYKEDINDVNEISKI